MRNGQTSRSRAVTGSEFARSPKLTDSVTAALRAAILSGEWERGQRLPNARQLADRFGVSAPTIREAVRALETMALVEVRQGSGTYVTLSAQDVLSGPLQTFLAFADVGVRDVMTLRVVLAKHSIAEAVRHATDADDAAIKDAEQTLNRIAETDDFLEVVSAAVRFESVLSATARNPLLHGLEVFLSESLRALLVRAWTIDAEQVLEAHHKSLPAFRIDRSDLVSALEKRDEAGAVIAMTALLEHEGVFYATDELDGVRLSVGDLLTMPEMSH